LSAGDPAIDQATVWLVIVGVSIGTYLLRLSFIELWKWLTVPPILMRALNYVPAAVLAALVFPALLRSGGAIDVSTDNLRLYAGIAAALVAWYSRNMLLTLGTGMVALWVLQAIASAAQ
jgi:branched-subunit amino acid transport protein